MKKIKAVCMCIVIVMIFSILTVYAQSANDIYSAYEKILDSYVSESSLGGEWTYYTLFDIDNNGSKELIVNYGGSDGSNAYGFSNGAVKDYGHCTDNVKNYYQKNNNLYILGCALDRVEEEYITYEIWIDRIILDNNKILHETIYNNPYYKVSMNDVDKNTEKNIPEVAEFLDGATEVRFINIRDRSLLEEIKTDNDAPLPTKSPSSNSNNIGTIQVNSNDLSIKVDGRNVNFTDGYPFIDSAGRTQVPIRFITEEMGYEVEWHRASMDYHNGAVSISSDNITTEYNGETAYMTLWLFIGSDDIALSYEDGPTTSSRHILGREDIYMDTTAMIKNDRTYIPLRYVAEVLGYTVDWK